jgi:hypothetical protein
MPRMMFALVTLLSLISAAQSETPAETPYAVNPCEDVRTLGVTEKCQGSRVDGRDEYRC